MQISHLKVDSPSRWGASEKALAMIDAARASGVDVQADQYAYTAASSRSGSAFRPGRSRAASAKIAERLNDPATWPRSRGRCGLLAERGLRDLSFA